MKRPLVALALPVLAVVVVVVAFVATRSRVAGPTDVGHVAPADPTLALEGVRVPLGNDAATVADVATIAPVVGAVPAREVRSGPSGCTLGGRVRSPTSGAGVEGAYVGLFTPANDEDSPTSEFGQWRGTSEWYPRHRQLLTWCSTTEDGSFRFTGLEAGTYVVRCELGPLVVKATAPQVLAVGELRAGLDVVLPEWGGVRGTLRAPRSADLRDLRMVLERTDPPETPGMMIDGRYEDSIACLFDEDGSYRIGPAATGRHRMSLEVLDRRASTGASRIQLGEVIVTAGDAVVKDFDLTDGFPSSVKLKFVFPGLTQSRARELTRSTLRLVAEPTSTALTTSTILCDVRRGTCVLGPLAPGRWKVRLVPPDGSWAWSPPSELLVPANTSSELEFAVPIVEANLTCLDAHTGRPLADVVLHIGAGAGPDEFLVHGSTDANGVVTLMLAPGTYSISVEDMEAPQDVSGLPEIVGWSDGGPRATTVRLLRP